MYDATSAQIRLIVADAFGGPEQLHLKTCPRQVAGRHEAVVKVAFAGVNFVDLYPGQAAVEVEALVWVRS